MSTIPRTTNVALTPQRVIEFAEDRLSGAARERVLELAGHWKHGYIPLDAVAYAIKMKQRRGDGKRRSGIARGSQADREAFRGEGSPIGPKPREATAGGRGKSRHNPDAHAAAAKAHLTGGKAKGAAPAGKSDADLAPANAGPKRFTANDLRKMQDDELQAIRDNPGDHTPATVKRARQVHENRKGARAERSAQNGAARADVGNEDDPAKRAEADGQAAQREANDARRASKSELQARAADGHEPSKSELARRAEKRDAKKLLARPAADDRYQVAEHPSGRGYEVLDTHAGNKIMGRHEGTGAMGGRNKALADARARNESTPEPGKRPTKRAESKSYQEFREARDAQRQRAEAATRGNVTGRNGGESEEIRQFYGEGEFAGQGTEERLTLKKWHADRRAGKDEDRRQQAAYDAGRKLGAVHGYRGSHPDDDADYEHDVKGHSGDAEESFGGGYSAGVVAGAARRDKETAAASNKPAVVGSMSNHGEIVSVVRTNGKHRVKIDGRQHGPGHDTREAALAEAHSLVPEHRRAGSEDEARALHVRLQNEQEQKRKDAVAKRAADNQASAAKQRAESARGERDRPQTDAEHAEAGNVGNKLQALHYSDSSRERLSVADLDGIIGSRFASENDKAKARRLRSEKSQAAAAPMAKRLQDMSDEQFASALKSGPLSGSNLTQGQKRAIAAEARRRLEARKQSGTAGIRDQVPDDSIRRNAVARADELAAKRASKAQGAQPRAETLTDAQLQAELNNPDLPAGGRRMQSLKAEQASRRGEGPTDTGPAEAPATAARLEKMSTEDVRKLADDPQATSAERAAARQEYTRRIRDDERTGLRNNAAMWHGEYAGKHSHKIGDTVTVTGRGGATGKYIGMSRDGRPRVEWSDGRIETVDKLKAAGDLPKGETPQDGAGHNLSSPDRPIRADTGRVNIVEAQAEARRLEAAKVKPVQDGMFGAHGEAQGDMFDQPADPAPAAAGIRVEHSGDGTVVYGTERGDTEATAALKAQGFKWSRNLDGWYLPRTWGESTRDQRVRGLEKALGDKVSVERGDVGVSTTAAERSQARIDRANELAAAHTERAERKATEADVRLGKAKAIGDMIPMGQPILVGHHSESRHRRDLAKIDRNMRAGFAAQGESEQATARAESAAARARQEVDPKAAARRLKRNEAELRLVERRLAGQNSMSGPATGEYADRLQASRRELADKIAHDRTIAGEPEFGKHNLQPGDVVVVRGEAHVVHSTGPKNVKLVTSVGPLPYPYDQIDRAQQLDKSSTAALQRLLAASQNPAPGRRGLPPGVEGRIRSILAGRADT